MSKHVWVIDDDHAIRWVLDRALAQAGIPIKAFNSADEAMHYLPKELPLAIITDIRMQGTSGLDFLEEFNIGGDCLSLMERQGGFLKESLALKISACVLLALTELRLRNIICRQISPENILIDSAGFAKLSNFSRAKKISHNSKTMTIFGVKSNLKLNYE